MSAASTASVIHIPLTKEVPVTGMRRKIRMLLEDYDHLKEPVSVAGASNSGTIILTYSGTGASGTIGGMATTGR